MTLENMSFQQTYFSFSVTWHHFCSTTAGNNFSVSWHYYYPTTSGKTVMRKRAVCPRCGWIARLRRVMCDENGCFEEYICTRCLYVFRIKIS